MAIKIALDAGHGLYTSGKQTPDGIKEWTLNDKVRDKIVAILADYDCEIINVDNDEGNTDESLTARVNKYLNAGVKAFVSIHHNAFTGSWNKATGVEVYVDQNATAEDLKLANLVYNRMVEYCDLAGRGIKRANFTVIHQNSVPAILCEGGFMDGSYDYKVITSAAGQNAYAKAVAEGLIEYLGLQKKAKPATNSDVLYRVQTGAYKVKANADAALAKVKAAGFSAFMVESNGYYKIQVGAYKVKANADKMAAKLVAAGFSTLITTNAGTAVTTTTKKSLDVVAKEVVQGKWGNGTDRKKKLKAAGYSDAEIKSIQDKVNKLV